MKMVFIHSTITILGKEQFIEVFFSEVDMQLSDINAFKCGKP